MTYYEDPGPSSKEELVMDGSEIVCLKCKASVGVTWEYVDVSEPEVGVDGFWSPRCDMCGEDVIGIYKIGAHPFRLFLEHLGKWKTGTEDETNVSHYELKRKFQTWWLGRGETGHDQEERIED